MKRLLLVAILLLALAGGGIWWWTQRSASPAKGTLGAAAYKHTEAILAIGPRPSGSPGLAKVLAYVKADLEKSGWSVQQQAFTKPTEIGNVAFVNLRARFANKGADPWAGTPDGILCAHIDSKLIPGEDFLGADDSASACAAIIEISRQLAASKPGQAAKLELVFFDGEEGFNDSMSTTDGLFGSREYAGLWRGKDKKPTFGILLDMIGHKNLRIALPIDSPPFLRDHVLAAAEDEQARRHFSDSSGSITDDHVPLNLVGIPTIDVIGDFQTFKWWHNKGGEKDDLSVISADSLDISMRVVLRTLDRLLPVK